MTRSPFDESARRIVRSVRTMVDHRAEYRAVNAAEFPGRDAEFLDGTARELAAEGWQTLGDFEDAAFNRGRQNKNFVRMALSGDRTAYAMWFSAPAAPRPARVLGLRSLLGDGRVLLTLRGGSKTDLPTPPAYLVERLDEGASTGQQVRRHRERVDAAGAAPRTHQGVADVLAALATEEKMQSEFRAARGLALFEPMLRAKLGPDFDERGQPLLDSILAHPEWWTAAPGSPAGQYPHLVIARLYEPIQPIDRGTRYEDPLQAALGARALGVVTGGGSALTREGEIAYVQLDLSVANLGAALDVAKQVLEQAGAPRGSELRFEREGQAMVVPFGTSEALAIYLDGTGLPDDVYTRCNINELVERVDAALGGSEKIRGSWSGPRETSLYLYGPSADAMFDKLQSVFADYPLCQNARVVIRHGNPALDSRTVRLPFPRG
ncbi:MAG: hypothetical protein DMD55_15565 [Gemmatimonadetes bacterium]|nr:MAG: hypothetical protein DMD55_15565 [Gemmatimonadota bacterium]